MNNNRIIYTKPSITELEIRYDYHYDNLLDNEDCLHYIQARCICSPLDQPLRLWRGYFY
jgi:hypothetical protein